MSTRSFDKPPLTYQQQIDQLKNRGLVIDNEPFALHLLENLSYFRLSGYWYPLLEDKTNHIFKPGSHLLTAFNLYCFDRELRILVLKEIEKIEVSVRAKMTYILSHRDGPFWFNNPLLFKNSGVQSSFLTTLQKEFSKTDEQFIKSYKNNYSTPLPPSWMAMEIITFGTLSWLYKNLRDGRNKTEIARHFGLSDTLLESWLHCLVYVRNICAHHSRLWNRVLGIQPASPRIPPQKQWLTHSAAPNNRTYYALSILLFFLQTVNPHNSFVFKFKALLLKYSTIDINSMGFDTQYNIEPLWKVEP